MAKMTVLDYPTATSFADDDFVLMDSITGGATKIKANTFEIESEESEEE